ncbi:MAG: hypothetical protein LUI87_09420 [Lachnospiraceae bacterium]|nr:hypothetical protein [Lachnospiraceae bacterium]
MVLAFAMTMVASASDYKITITNAVSGETYTAYKVFDATYNSSGNVAYTIDSNSKWYNLINSNANGSGEDLFTLTAAASTASQSVITYVVTYDESNKQKITNWFNSLDLAANGITTTDAAASDTASSSTLVLDVGAVGYYYVTSTLGSLVSLDSTIPTATITDKNSEPSVDKKVSNDGNTYVGTNTAYIGETVYFQTTIKNFYKTNNLELLVDNMDDGLEFKEVVSVMYYEDVSASGQNIKSSVTVDETDPDVAFTIDFSTVLSSLTVTDESYIVITYSATVTGDGTTTEYDNDTYVKYGGGSTSTKSTTTTYVSEFTLNKTNSSSTTIDGAVFTLTDLTDNPVYFTVSTVSGSTVYTYETDSTASGATTEIGAGEVTIFGLPVGTYTLTETTAPDGYNKLTSTISITISETTDSNGVTGTSMSYTYNNATETGAEIKVVNQAGQEMPTTGGIGTTIFYVFGGLLVLLAAVLLFTRWAMLRKTNQ